MRKSLLLGATLALLSSSWSHAEANDHIAVDQCRERGKMVEVLAKHYKETSIALGLTDTGELLELFTTLDGTTWTIIVTLPQGISCLLVSGESWQGLVRKPTGPKV